MKQKLIKDMHEEDCFAFPAASNSTLGRMRRSPAHCKVYMDEGLQPTASMKLGSLVHTLILESHLFKERYYVASEGDPSAPRKSAVVEIVSLMQADDDTVKFVTPPDINKRTKAGKEEFAEFEAKCERENLTIISEADLLVAKNYHDYLFLIGNKEVINQDTLDKAIAMAEQVKNHPSASKLLAHGTAEQSIFWHDKEADYPCKARIDFESDMGYLVDLKTSRDASKAEFARSIAKFGYHRQNAMYRDGYIEATGKTPKGFIFIVVESEPPYSVGVYSLDPEGVEIGQAEYKHLLAEFAECQKEDNWPAYSDQVETIELPRWYN